MLTSLRYVFAGILALAFLTAAFGQGAAVTGAAGGTQILPLNQVKEGDRGVARTVFRGYASEEFNVEILGVVPGAIGPHQDLIIGKLSGANAERTFVFAGMSGSPVYIGGKLVGAIAYSFPFSKEPICGITPIEQMVSIFERAPEMRPAAAQNRVYTLNELRAVSLMPDGGRERSSGAVISGMASGSRLTAVAGQTFTPIATPMTFSGVTQATLDQFAPLLERGGIMPVAAVGGSAKMTPLIPAGEKSLLGGDSVVVNLARGDVSVAAAGTVTLRDGEKIYAFGHPYFGLGSSDLPMSESHVVTVVPNANNSFKLAVPDALVGSISQDRATGIFGALGRQPKLIPVTVDITTSRGRKEQIKFETAVDDFLTPVVVNVGIQNTLAAFERSLGDTTVELTSEIAIAGEKSVIVNRRFAGNQATAYAASAPAIPMSLLLKGGFEGFNITGVKVAVKVVDGSKTAALDRLTTDRTQVKAGETLELTAYVRNEAGQIISQKVPVTIPRDAAPGTITVAVADGNTLLEKSTSAQFVARSAAELINTINGLKRADRLYAVAYRTTTGAIIGSSEMPNLPPSFLATLNNDRSAGGSKPTVQTFIIEQELPQLDYLVTGQQTLTIEVVR